MAVASAFPAIPFFLISGATVVGLTTPFALDTVALPTDENYGFDRLAAVSALPTRCRPQSTSAGDLSEGHPTTLPSLLAAIDKSLYALSPPANRSSPQWLQ